MRHLTYSNVMATIAVFIALGAGAYAAIQLPPNSVKSRNIAPGQVKPADLAASIRPIPFSYSKPINTVIQSTLVNRAGYRLVASCPQVSNSRPAAQVAIQLPKDGTIDSLQAQTTGGSVPTPGLGRLAVQAGTPLSLTGPPGAFAPTVGEVAVVSGVLTYVGKGRTALIAMTIRANDATNRCDVSGAIVPVG